MVEIEARIIDRREAPLEKEGRKKPAVHLAARGIFLKEKTSSQVRVGAPSARRAGGGVPLLRSRVGEAPDSTRALWHASRRQPTMEQMFFLLLLLLLLFWRSSNATPSLAFIFFYTQDLCRHVCLPVRVRSPMFSPKNPRAPNRFVKIRLIRNIDLLYTRLTIFDGAPPLGRV